jgi:cytoskeletal protein CcmA (bactofilin family)
MFFLRGSGGLDGVTNKEEVTLSSESLDKLGISKTAVANLGTELIVGPNSTFNNKVTIAGDVSIAGQLRLNSKFSASDASLTNLQAGNTALQQLNVNGESSLSTLNVRNNLNVTGTTNLQGTVTVSQLLTVNNNLNVSGNLAVGGVLSARTFQASSLVSDTTLTIGGHIVTRGLAPGVGGGGALGSNGTVSISGNDAAGTVAVNIGVGASSGLIAQVTFKNGYTNTPKIMVTAVGRSMDLYVNRSASGFSIYTGVALPPGGYAVDYMVMQ